MAVSEERSLDEVIQALYESISGAAGEPRDWDRMRALFYPGARLVRTSVDERGRPKAQSMDVEEYIRDVSPYLREHPFYEAEISRRLDRFGNVAHALSTYEARHDPADPEPFKRGVNSIQLYNDGTRWWIVNALWDNEREGNPVPARYLTRS